MAVQHFVFSSSVIATLDNVLRNDILLRMLEMKPVGYEVVEILQCDMFMSVHMFIGYLLCKHVSVGTMECMDTQYILL